MLKFFFILIVIAPIYLLCKYLYVCLSKKLKESTTTRNNYIVRNILLSSNHESIDIFDIIVVLVIAYSIFYK